MTRGPNLADLAGQDRSGTQASVVDQNIDVEVGRRIFARRRALRITQRELGTAIGVSFQQISKMESGTPASTTRLWALARALGVPVCFFFGGCPNGASDTAGRPSTASAQGRCDEILG
ncbi:MAG: helix-turn-helix domain-containing protein [Caulobacteraceae bacterium]